MKMPVVSLNTMAMNESVAATCCFRQHSGDFGLMETVLSGGTLSRKIVNTPTYIDPDFDKRWLTIVGDLQPVVDNPTAKYATVETIGGCTVVTCDGAIVTKGDLVTGDEYWMIPGSTNCPHQDLTCNYIESIEESVVLTHIDATVEHGGIKDWGAAHTAVRFNS